MLGKERSKSYSEFINEDEDDKDEGNAQSPGFFDGAIEDLEREEPGDGTSQAGEDDNKGSGSSRRFSKTCLRNVFTVVLIFIYLMLTGVAIFLAYQNISDFLEKLNNPVMSVTYKEVDSFSAPGIALYPGKAQLLGCKHHFNHYIPPLVDPGKPQAGDCVMEDVTYFGPFSKQKIRALVVRGPTQVRRKEAIFMQFSLNETEEDFSAINYVLFSTFGDLMHSANKSIFMRECEKNYSLWTFSGGFRTWVKMSLVKTSGKNNGYGVEFRQESAVVKFNDKRPDSEKSNQLFFAVFQWRDPYIQEIRQIVTANGWNSIAILCGCFMALFKAANLAELTVQWIIRMRKRHLRNKNRELKQIN